MDSYKSSSFLKCICCGVAVLFLGAEMGPGIYQALCHHCHEHIGHLAKHTHQEEHRPFNAGGGIRSVILSTSTSTIAPSGDFFVTS